MSEKQPKVKMASFDNYLKKKYKNKPETLESMEEGAKQLGVIHDLVQARKKARLGQVALAKKLNVEQSFISRIEQGNVDIRVSTLTRYANALNKKIKVI